MVLTLGSYLIYVFSEILYSIDISLAIEISLQYKFNTFRIWNLLYYHFSEFFIIYLVLLFSTKTSPLRVEPSQHFLFSSPFDELLFCWSGHAFWHIILYFWKSMLDFIVTFMVLVFLGWRFFFSFYLFPPAAMISEASFSKKFSEPVYWSVLMLLVVCQLGEGD